MTIAPFTPSRSVLPVPMSIVVGPSVAALLSVRMFVTPGLARTISGASIYRKKRFSDHAPLTVDYDYEP